MTMAFQQRGVTLIGPTRRDGQPPQMAYPMQEIAAQIFAIGAGQTLSHVMVVGAARKVGTSFIVQCLADTLSGNGNRVLIVEVRPDQSDRGDLSRLLANPVTSSTGQMVRLRLGHAEVMTLMAPGSTTFEQVTLGLRERFEIVLWDMPPPGLATPTAVAARLMDGVILVVETNRTTKRVLSHVASRLRASQAPLLGVVMNRIRKRLPGWLDGVV